LVKKVKTAKIGSHCFGFFVVNGGFMEDNLVFFGDPVKALGEGRVAGYLVRYGSPADPDLTNDYFTSETDLGIEQDSRLPVYYEHGFDSVLKSRKIGAGVIKLDDTGAWLEAQLNMRDEYERMIYQMAIDGKLGWSSGAAGHLVERESVGKSYHIKSWVIAEASLTPTPAEPRNSVMPVKSLYLPEAEIPPVEESPIEEGKNMPEDIKEIDYSQVIDSAVQQALKKYAEAQPQVTAGFAVEDEADRALKGNPFKTAGDFFMAVKDAEISPSQIDKRLLPLKASGLNEAMPSQGGFLVTPDIASGIYQNMWGEGSLLRFFNPINVSGNGLTVHAIDETSRADGSRMGGVQGYWMAEAAEKTATKPKFRDINLKLKKVAALMYATDELLEDATALESWIMNNVPNELRFKVEDAIINGDGVGKPLGILGSGALVSAVRTDADQIDVYDITRMWASRLTGPTDYIWLISPTIAPQLYTLAITNPVYLPPGGFSGAMYGSLFGRPVVETEYNPGLGDLGDIMLVSPSAYAFIAKGGVQAASSIHVKFVNDETAFRFVYRCDGQPLLASAITRYKSSSDITTCSPFVALAATT
jgi:HK97 family phage major capsid protein